MDAADVFGCTTSQRPEATSVSELWCVIDEMPAEVFVAAMLSASWLLQQGLQR